MPRRSFSFYVPPLPNLLVRAALSDGLQITREPLHLLVYSSSPPFDCSSESLFISLLSSCEWKLITHPN